MSHFKERMKSSGKVLTVFLIIGAILLLSLTAISMFFFQIEMEKRKAAELSLEKTAASVQKFEDEAKELKKQNFLLQEKNKEVDDKINSLMDELDLEQGLRDQLKAENDSMKQKLDAEVKAKEDIRQQLTAVQSSSQEKIAQLEQQLQEKTLENKKLTESMATGSKDIAAMEDAPAPAVTATTDQADPALEKNRSDKSAIDLDNIIISNDQNLKDNQAPEKMQGRILSVDTETEFVIVNLGEKNGVAIGNVMSVYRGNDYLGDVKVTRVQPQMSAADFIPPFSSRSVRKNDQVVMKE